MELKLLPEIKIKWPPSSTEHPFDPESLYPFFLENDGLSYSFSDPAFFTDFVNNSIIFNQVSLPTTSFLQKTSLFKDGILINDFPFLPIKTNKFDLNFVNYWIEHLCCTGPNSYEYRFFSPEYFCIDRAGLKHELFSKELIKSLSFQYKNDFWFLVKTLYIHTT